MESRKYRYQYPNNLAEKPRIGLWTLSELVVLAVLALVLVTIGLRKGVMGLALCIVAGVGLLSAHFGGSDRSVFEYLMTMIIYLKNPQVWEYDPLFSGVKVIERKEKKGKAVKNRNRMWLVVSLLLIIGFAALVVWSEMKR